MEETVLLRHPGEIAGYELLGIIGRGAFGEVWKAKETTTSVLRAVKVVYHEDALMAQIDFEGMKRYRRSGCEHPHLVRIETVQQNDRCHYCVMELADNGKSNLHDEYEAVTLRRWMRRECPMTPALALQTLLKLTEGVECLHRHGIRHNDLKPENIVLIHGKPKIVDMGLASDDRVVVHGGARGYMTPEGKADDLYALGMILYELLSGYPTHEYPFGLIGSSQRDSSVRTASALQVVNRAVASEPTERYRSAMELREKLAEAIRTHENGNSPSFWQRLIERVRRRPLLSAGVMMVGVTIVSTIVYSLRSTKTRDPLEDRQDSGARVRVSMTSEEELQLSTSHSWVAVSGRTDQPEPYRSHVFLEGAMLPKPGMYRYALASPVENYVLECRFRMLRPWGTLWIGMSDDLDGAPRVGARLHAMPDGRGLYTTVECFGPDDKLTHEAPKVLKGHPLPGTHYVLRVGSCGEKVELVLWPLGAAAPRPLVRVIDRFALPLPDEAHFVLLEAATSDPHAAVEIEEIKVRGFNHALERLDQEPLPLVPTRQAPGWHAPLRTARPASGVNLLDPPTHPYASDAWSSIGSWSWWSSPDAWKLPEAIRCVPFSSDERRNSLDCDAFGAWQVLRFDGAEYEDFVATVRINLVDPRTPNTKPRQPAVCDSSSYYVGLAFHMQDQAPAGATWGGGYVAVLGFTTDVVSADPEFTIQKWEGLVVADPDPSDDASVATSPGSRILAEERTRPWPFGVERFGGFDLTVKAKGPSVSLWLGDERVLEAVDQAQPFIRGRIGLVTNRMIATFERVSIQPMD